MADKENVNDEPEENKDHFDDDEDFGLPDLEYDELDDDVDEDEDEEPESSAEPVEETAAPAEEEVVSEDETDSDDTDVEISEDWEKELEKELEEELESEDANVFYEEESYEEFEDSGEAVIDDSVFEDDAAAASAPTSTASDSSYSNKPKYQPTYQQDDGSSKGKFVRTVVIGTLSFVILAVVFMFLYEGDNEAKKPVAKKVEPKVEPVVQPEPVVKEEPPKKVEKPKPQPRPVGEVTTLPQQTGKTYIVVASFFDGDMASDYSNKLARDGKSPMIIPPFKEYRFYRVAIAEYNSFKDAQAGLETFKGEFGPDIWPLRY